jgi:hypothetical protein
VPHIGDKRPDTAVLALSGCDAVLRPTIPNHITAIGQFIDNVLAAEFVPSGSLHPAIVAAACGRPFAFWDSGMVDVPFKWADFTASAGIPCAFRTRIEAHERTTTPPSVPRCVFH